MKTHLKLLVLILVLAVVGSAKAESLIINGIYQGKDLYIKNPFSSDGVGFCVYEVFVNGDLTRDEVNSSAFAIDFNVLGIEVGSAIEVIVKHKKGCEPLVLNPEAIKPHSTYELKSIDVKNNILEWTVENESGSLPFIVEQFKWQKWVKAGEVQGEGDAGANTYRFELTPYSGENRVRVKQLDYSKKARYSKEVTYVSKTPKVSFEPKKADAKITFSAPTSYEIFDKYGKLVKTGYGSSIDVENLTKGEDYYLNYDSSFGETFRKK